MNVLSISSDRKIFDPRSASALRQIAYGDRFGALNIIVFSLRQHECASTDLSQNVHVHPTSSRSKFLYIFDALRLAKKLTRPDVVTSQDPFEAGIAGWRMARHFRTPLHVQVHTDFLSPAFAKLSYLNRVRVYISRFVLKRASGIRVVSERIRNSLQATNYKLQTRITVLPIYVDIAKFQNAEPLSDSTWNPHYKYKLLVVSRNAPEKNIQLAVDSFEKSAPHDACLIICGNIVEKNVIEQRSGRIYHVNLDPARLYKSADLVLVPSKYEGYGLVIIEALAAGKPVLATDVGIAREAGAIVTTEEQFGSALAAWFKDGPRTGELKNYPYKNFNTYVQTYCDDIKACTKV